MPKRNQKDITSLIEEFQYPKYGPGMMWERCREKVEAAGTKVVMETPVTRVLHRDGEAVAVVAGRRTAPRPSTGQRGRLVHADHRIAQGHGSAGPGRRASRRPMTSTTATSSPWRWSFPRRPGSPTTGSTCTRPTSSWAASRTSARGRPTWSRKGEPASASSTSCSRATSTGRCPTTSWSSSASGSWPCSAWSIPAEVEAGYVVRMPKAYPYYDGGLQGQRRDAAGLARRPTPPTSIRSVATACTSTTTRTTRCTPPC